MKDQKAHPISRVLLLSLLLFLVWKFFLTSVLWGDRIVPPEADDSYIYIANIESVRRCQSLLFCKDTLYPLNSSLGIDRLTYRLAFGAFAKIAGLSAFETYKYSFFIGYVFLVPVLYVFIRLISKSHLDAAVSVLALTAYHGFGSFHGFYWVVPSFFSIVIFWTLISVIIRGPRNWHVYAGVLTIIGLYTHLISFYLIMGILPLLYFFYSLLSRRIDWDFGKRTLLVISIALITYSSTELFLNQNKSIYSYGVISSISSLSQKTDDPEIQTSEPKANNGAAQKDGSIRTDSREATRYPGFSDLYESYFKFFLLHWSLPLIFVAMLCLLQKANYRLTVALYLAGLVFSLATSISEFASRSLIFLWPMTYVVIGQFIWLASGTLCKRHLTVLAHLVWTSFVIFLIINYLFSYFSNEQMSTDYSYNVDPKIDEFVKENLGPPNYVYYTGKLTESYFASNSLYKLINRISDINASCYYLNSIKTEDNFDNSKLNKLFNKMSAITGYERIQSQSQDNIEIPPGPKGFQFYNAFGSILVYKSKNCINP